MSRVAVLKRLAAAMVALRPPHPTRVAIAGISASGKTTLADELAPVIEGLGRPCVRASLDDFHPPGHKYRSAAGGYTPDSYYDEAFDYDRLVDLLLQPLGPSGGRRCRLALHDSFNDVPFPEKWYEVEPATVVVIDGSYLLGPDLVEHWDYSVWLDIDFETSLERARKRDIAWVHSEAAVVERYRTRNFPAYERYLRESRAPQTADAVIDQGDFMDPRVVRLREPG